MTEKNNITWATSWSSWHFPALPNVPVILKGYVEDALSVKIVYFYKEIPNYTSIEIQLVYRNEQAIFLNLHNS